MSLLNNCLGLKITTTLFNQIVSDKIRLKIVKSYLHI